MKFLFVLLSLFSSIPSSFAATGKCAQFEGNAQYMKALDLLSQRMRYSKEEMCNLPHLADIYITHRVFLNPQQQPERHIWVTFHYNEYSCQYFIRESDFELTRKNCYNTW